ncbi:hypothetical protein CVV26_01550 [Candidatus Kuenenbacteria bacterium HGW-Kuenenbacteria-1]|uniref:Uncharacterized protein n=1 Tax=Candidatus Kuenenbacteria bacterium HGW-Kuenenbacteria-1 TaxID=2013812 RepID=A0A2N1UNS4_9BACT|nr:MAG: hypothetical protein CVV26_01550 [Candidatus Kuenenbacteria bacterium HGW-Kuenenbacteria-1]
MIREFEGGVDFTDLHQEGLEKTVENYEEVLKSLPLDVLKKLEGSLSEKFQELQKVSKETTDMLKLFYSREKKK